MRRKYDSYEVEIILSLGFLLLFLISINFISGYSFERARVIQRDMFEKNLGLATDYAVSFVEGEMEKFGYSRSFTESYFHSLAARIGAENIVLLDSLDRTLASSSNNIQAKHDDYYTTIERSISNLDGNPVFRVRVTAFNAVGQKLARLSRWDMIFRLLGLVAALIVSGIFLKAILLPYRRIKREALDFNLDTSEPGQKPGIEYIVRTFKILVNELEEKRHRLENLYRHSEQRADSLARYNDYILGSITSGVIICDSNGVVTRFNRSAQNILQCLEKECLGKQYREIFSDGHRLVSLFDDALFGGQVHSRLEFDIRRPDGDRLWLGCSSSLINDEKGGGMGVVLLLIDLTEIRRLREQTSYSEKMAALGETAAGLAHEVRNSFAAIVGFANLIRKQSGPEPRTTKIADAIKEESTAAESLMTRFLSFARPLDLIPESVNFHEIIESAIKNASHPQLGKIKISRHIPGSIPEIVGDSALLRQAFSNLIINACDALPDGGEIEIHANWESSQRNPAQSFLVINVIDNGGGIEPEIESRIFEPFVSGKPHGTGLGLALVKKIVVLHGGRIEVHSRLGKGTKFTIYLPTQRIAEPVI